MGWHTGETTQCGVTREQESCAFTQEVLFVEGYDINNISWVNAHHSSGIQDLALSSRQPLDAVPSLT